VRTRAGRPIPEATVDLDTGAKVLSGKTDNRGFFAQTLTSADLAAATPPGSITVRVRKHHHGPDPGIGGTVTSGILSVTATVDSSGFDPSTPGLAKDAQGGFLDCLLVDGGYAFAADSFMTLARRLTDDEVQKELMLRHHQGHVTLDAASDFVFDHDTSMGEFDPCDPAKCHILRPLASTRVSLASPVMAGVRFFALTNFSPSPPQSTSDVIPGQRFLRDAFDWQATALRLLDQRHIVGLVRMCSELSSTRGIVALYTQGVSGDTVRPDTHGYGLALDFGGVSTELPDPNEKHRTVRLGTDFIVFLHWGRVPMWDRVSVASNPTDPSKWVRLTKLDDDFNYGTDPTGAHSRLHYRLDPPPFQDPVPASAPSAFAADLAKVATHFQMAASLFQDVYEFAVGEYSDGNTILGRLPKGTSDTPTPIDSHAGHFILHPDYPHPNNPPNAHNGRGAHINHLHFQLGPTFYSAGPRTT